MQLTKNHFKGIIVGFCLLLTFSCSKNQIDTNVIDTALKKYVYAYTKGIISSKSNIRVYFANSIVGDDQLFKELKSAFKFKPSISGKMHWEDSKTLVFVPDKKLKSNENYAVSLDLKQFIPNIEEVDNSLNFSFSTKALNYTLFEDGLTFYRDGNQKKVHVNLNIQTSDAIDTDALKQMLRLDVEEDQMEWTSNATSTMHKLKISGFTQTSKEQELKIKLFPSKIGINQDDETLKVIIPEKGPFKLINLIQDPNSNQNFKLIFSDEVLQGQNLRGLINIRGSNTSLEFDIDGNTITVFPKNNIRNEISVQVNKGIKSAYEEALSIDQVWDLNYKIQNPQIEITDNGIIASDIDKTLLSFNAINLSKVDVEIFKIYDNNILQFLQTNNLDGGYELRRVGKIVFKGAVSLSELNKTALQREWSNYALDLSNFISKEPNAIYQVRIGFRPGYVASGLPANERIEWTDYEKGLSNDLPNNQYNSNGSGKSIMDMYYGPRGYYNKYSWNNRENMDYPEYYHSNQFVSKNIIASSIGIIAKRTSSDSYVFLLNDLNTTTPLSGKTIRVFDYQQQIIQEATTDANGMAIVKNAENAFVAVAYSDQSNGFIKLDNRTSLSTASFEVGGTVSKEGFKGMFYGERGVWRPGDSLFVNFILQDPKDELPADYPVSFKFYNPKGTMVNEMVASDNTGGIYPVHLSTASEDITGTYRLVAQVGTSNFTKYLKVETIKPNRLKIKYALPEQLSASNEPYSENLQVNWLHGSPGSNLRTRVELQFSKAATSFKSFDDYKFNDINRYVPGNTNVLFDQKLDADGVGKIVKKFWNKNPVPGKMEARIKITAFEDGGNFSTSTLRRPYSPYDRYVGIRVPKNEYGYNIILKNRDTPIDVVCVDNEGKSAGDRSLNYAVYKVNWSWWWSRGNDNSTNYINRSSTVLLSSGSVKTNNKGKGSFDVKAETWGRYMIRVCDNNNHCTTDFVYAGSPDYNDIQDSEDINLLSMKLDKPSYEPEETATIEIQGADNARFLVSIEKGGDVLSTTWVDAKAGSNEIELKIKKEWAPNVYASVYMLQGNQTKANDRPLRMFGITPIMVEDPESRLSPVISSVDQIEPLQEFEVEVKEEDGKPMAYTIAIVDEGLLDITNFKTPNPWNYFYQKEALGVRSYDIYEFVLGRFSGQMNNIIAVGGAAELKEAEADKKDANRFKPVVMTAGPFYAKKGQNKKHTFTMPNYLGSVRAMVVAVDDESYGSSEKTITVNQPVMVLSTLPRVLGTTEKLSIPVTVFNNTNKDASVQVTVSEKSKLVQFTEGQKKTVNVAANDNTLVYFPVEVLDAVGIAYFDVQAKSGSNKSSQQVELEIRNPNPIQKSLDFIALNAGESHSFDYLASGVKGTNKVLLEASNFPDLNMNNRLDYLIRYPYGCLEQTTSSVFPQLYLSQILELSEQKEKEIDANIKAGIDRLTRFITPSNGFTYWPGQDNYYNTWANSYAGHFLVEAKAKGFEVPRELFNSWLRYTKGACQSWSSNKVNSAYGQAYALYVLALAGEADLSAMNRLKESQILKGDDRTLLAGAYIVIGQKEIGNSLLSQAKWGEMNNNGNYRYRYYGSVLRDQALLLEIYTKNDPKDKKTLDLARHIAKKLNSNYYYNTQTLALSLKSIGQLLDLNGSGEQSKFIVSQNKGDETAYNFAKSSISVDNLQAANGTITVKNTGKNVLYFNLIKFEQPLQADEVERSSNLSVNVEYLGKDGNSINPSSLEMGTEFLAKVTVRNIGNEDYYEDLALNQTFPSGWEIINERMDNLSSGYSNSGHDFRDIRDDRIYTFFRLNRNGTKVFYTRLIATYEGNYYEPASSCSSMYRNDIFASKPGKWIKVIPSMNQ
jgi:uncharacterized protein YfaS (alpha-2-macroglobulin family)